MSLSNALRRIDDGACRIEDVLLTVLISLVTLLVCAAVAYRYVLNDPLTWSEELIILLFDWMIFLGVANAFRARSHIIIDVVVLFAPIGLARWLGMAATLATAAVLLVLSYFASMYMWREIPNLTPMLGISAGWAIAPLAIGLMLSLLHLVRNGLEHGMEGVLWSDITQRES